MYNLYDDEEEEGSGGNENLEENLRMKEKMRLLRTKMENLTVTKKVNSSKNILFYFLASSASKKTPHGTLYINCIQIMFSSQRKNCLILHLVDQKVVHDIIVISPQVPENPSITRCRTPWYQRTILFLR